MRPLVFEERGCDLLEITLNYGIRGAPSDWSVLPKLVAHLIGQFYPIL